MYELDALNYFSKIFNKEGNIKLNYKSWIYDPWDELFPYVKEYLPDYVKNYNFSDESDAIKIVKEINEEDYFPYRFISYYVEILKGNKNHKTGEEIIVSEDELFHIIRDGYYDRDDYCEYLYPCKIKKFIMLYPYMPLSIMSEEDKYSKCETLYSEFRLE